MAPPARVLFVGLDCASPELVLGRWRAELPVLSGLLEGASYGRLRAVHPPITVPAWACMLTGRDPGELGLYGFRTRPDREGTPPRLCDSSSLQAPAIWDLAGGAGLESVVVGFPPSYPPRPLAGRLVSGPLTPPDADDYTWPPELRGDVERWVGRYRFDVDEYRTDDPARLAAEVREMTSRRFALVRALLRSAPWRFAFVHEIGLDRMQHACWPDPGDPADPRAELLLAYHRQLDAELGETLEATPDGTALLVASDHGARPLRGSLCLNEWLAAEGYLALAGAASWERELDPACVDWARTAAFADGGYCGRVYLPGQERGPGGVLATGRGRALRDEIREKLESLCGPDGEPLGNAVYAPEEVYVRTEGVAPDLLVYAGDLDLRCAGSVAGGRIFLDGNDTGPDRANHDWDGLFVLHDPRGGGGGERSDRHQLDVAPTLMRLLDLPVPGWMRGGALA